MVGKMETINIYKASRTTNVFYLFFHGGKAAIIPFLTLFFRLIGLNALEVGIIIAVKTLTSLVWAPLWARCATSYNRHRLVLVISLFMMLVTYLLFPALYTQLSKPEHCSHVLGSNHSSNLPHHPSGPESPTSLPNSSKFPSGHFTTQITATTRGTIINTISPTTNNVPEPHQQAHLSSKVSGVDMTTALPTTPQTASVGKITVLPSPVTNRSSEMTEKGLLNELIEDLQNLTKQDFKVYIDSMYPDQELSEDEVSDIYNKLRFRAGKDMQKEVKKRSASEHIVRKRDWISQVRDKLQPIQSSLQNDKLLLLLILLAIIVGSEIFASAVEKVADDSWFDFLNRIDDLERYGQQRIWGSLAFVIIPIIVTVAVDKTPCFLPLHFHHFLLHFYVFAVLTAGALAVACCYPVPPPANSKYMSKITKGLRVICCDGRGFLFSVTLLLSGMVYAAYHNFLFWRIQDLGGKETPMGLCVSIGAFSEIPMLILSGHFVKKLGHSWLVSMCLFTLSLRVLYYAFIPEPWAFLPIELTHGITHTALWFAILSYDDFNVGAAIDRSIRSILSSFYFGVGFSAGSIVSGFIFHNFDSSVLFWGCSAVTGGWTLLYSIIQKCIPQKEKVRYIKLLRSDSDNSDDEEDDWLEMALKDH